MMDSLLHPSTPVHSGFANAARLIRHVGLLAGAVFCLALPTYAEVTSNSAGLDLPNVKAVNNQPIPGPTRDAVHNERIKPSSDYRDSDGIQVEEYRFQKGQAPDIHVKSGMGTSHSLSKLEDNSLRIRECDDIDRVPPVNVLKL